MSISHTASSSSSSDRGGFLRDPLMRWIGGGLVAIAAAIAIAIAVWPASEADKARADGEQVGQAVTALYDASSAEEVDAALADLHTAVADTRDHAGDAVAEQVADQEDALARAADGFVGVHTSTDAWEVDLYQAELNDAVADLGNQAEDFRSTGPEVQQAFWDGYESTVTIG